MNILITGGAGGIGKATAETMAGLGAKVFITDVNEEVIASAIDEMRKNGITVFGAACDITDAKSVRRMVAECVDKFGTVDVLVNCAGIYKDVLFKDMTDAQWHQTINIDLNGIYNSTKAVTDIMTAQKFGRIINLTSQAAISGSVLHSHYSAAKAGVVGLTVSLARELAEYNIRVNCVAPGIINTKMVEQGAKERGDMWMQNIPMKRFGTAKEVANVIAFLASDYSSYMTGQTLNVTGGWLLHS